ALADVTLARNTTVDVSEGFGRTGGGGSVFVRGHDVSLDEAGILARTVSGGGRVIDVAAAGALTVRRSEVVAVTTGKGAAASIALSARDVVIADGSLVDTSCDPGCTSGNGGHLEIRAGNVFRVEGTRSDAPTYIVSNSFGGGLNGTIDITAPSVVLDGNAFIQGIGLSTGNGSTIRIHSHDLTLSNGAQVDASSRGSGRGGDVIVDNAGAIVVRGTRADATQNGLLLPSGFFSNAEGAGNAGSVSVSTGSISILDGAEISSSARRGSTGRGGNVSIAALELIRVAGTDASGKPSGIATNTFATGDAGRITLAAPSIEVVDDARVQSQSEGAGAAGTIHIEGRDVRLAEGGQISSDARGTGDAGNIELELGGTLDITGANAGIFAKTYATAQGGNISVHAARVAIDGAGGLFASTDGAGKAGSIAVRAQREIVMAHGARIASEASSSGNAGSLDVHSDGRIGLSQSAQITTSSALGGGDAGSVSVTSAGLLTLGSGARIASESAGTGLAGDLLVGSIAGIELGAGASITTSARQSDGGNIRVESPSHVSLASSAITTAVGQGLGNGGNVVVDTPLLLLRDAVVSANAFGGNGGNIRIAAANLFSNPSTRVTASSQLGIDGTVRFDSPAIDLSGALLSLATGFLDLGAIAAGRCGARLAAGSSSLVVRRFDPGESLRNGFFLSRRASPSAFEGAACAAVRPALVAR
ncbi:MAG: hypothetical protein ABIY55_10760, partial [Kofleriaceae bacterium]